MSGKSGRGFFDIAEGHDDTGLLAVKTKPMPENADVAEAFMRLGRLSHDERYLQTAYEALADFAETYKGYGTQGARYALAVERYLSPEPEIQVMGAPPVDESIEAPPEAVRRASALHQRALRLPLATRTVQLLVPGRDDHLIQQLMLPVDREGVAYVCVGTVCSEPVESTQELEGAITHALSAPTF